MIRIQLWRLIVNIMLKNTEEVFHRPIRLTLSGSIPASMALVAPVGRKHFAEYKLLSKPASLIATSNICATVAGPIAE